jgi:hypothetical protein
MNTRSRSTKPHTGSPRPEPIPNWSTLPAPTKLRSETTDKS